VHSEAAIVSLGPKTEVPFGNRSHQGQTEFNTIADIYHRARRTYYLTQIPNISGYHRPVARECLKDHGRTALAP
jgi:hypothetical protein